MFLVPNVRAVAFPQVVMVTELTKQTPKHDKTTKNTANFILLFKLFDSLKTVGYEIKFVSELTFYCNWNAFYVLKDCALICVMT